MVQGWRFLTTSDRCWLKVQRPMRASSDDGRTYAADSQRKKFDLPVSVQDSQNNSIMVILVIFVIGFREMVKSKVWWVLIQFNLTITKTTQTDKMETRWRRDRDEMETRWR